MHERILEGLRQAGDLALFGTGIHVIVGAASGYSAYDVGAILSGAGLGFYGIARGTHWFAASYVKFKEGQLLGKYGSKEYYDFMRDFVCFNAKECIDRKTEYDGL